LKSFINTIQHQDAIKKVMLMKYICGNCKYRFEPKTGKVPKTCPFCNSTAVSKEATTSDILDDLSRNPMSR
jgi:predicted Zn-ribbon and HTH transcriptional regulator